MCEITQTQLDKKNENLSAWCELSRGFKISAEVLWNSQYNVVEVPKSNCDNFDVENVGLRSCLNLVTKGTKITDGWRKAFLHKHFRNITLLSGYSLELIAKALSIQKGERLLKTHDLKRLFEHARLDYGGYEETLKILTEFIIWISKYPTPTRPEDYYILRHSSERAHDINEEITWKEFNDLYDKYHPQIDPFHFIRKNTT